MTNSFWDNIAYFKPTERNIFKKRAFPEPNAINPAIVYILDKLREETTTIIIHSTNEKDTEHVKGSQHYLDNAIDFHIKNMNFIDAIEKVITLTTVYTFLDRPLHDYMGIGIYPDWNNPGFHLDFRGYQASWGRIGNNYVSFDEALKYALDKFK